jgi:peroxiredoxin
MRIKLAAILICTALVLGCASGKSGIDRIQAGDQAPSFLLGNVFGGDRVDSRMLFENHPVTVVVLWSMACPTCREALADIQQVYEQYSAKAVGFVGINFDIENMQGVRAFLKGEGIEFPMLWDRGMRVTRDYKALDYTFSLFVVKRDLTVIMAQYDHPPDLVEDLTETLDDIVSRYD